MRFVYRFPTESDLPEAGGDVWRRAAGRQRTAGGRRRLDEASPGRPRQTEADTGAEADRQSGAQAGGPAVLLQQACSQREMASERGTTPPSRGWRKLKGLPKGGNILGPRDPGRVL